MWCYVTGIVFFCTILLKLINHIVQKIIIIIICKISNGMPKKDGNLENF